MDQPLTRDLAQTQRKLAAWARAQRNPALKSQGKLIARRLQLNSATPTTAQIRQLKTMVDNLARAARSFRARNDPALARRRADAKIPAWIRDDHREDVMQDACERQVEGKELSQAVSEAIAEKGNTPLMSKNGKGVSMDAPDRFGRTGHERMRGKNDDE